jgi:DNA-binding NarL/FixJ family response regulator
MEPRSGASTQPPRRWRSLGAVWRLVQFDSDYARDAVEVGRGRRCLPRPRLSCGTQSGISRGSKAGTGRILGELGLEGYSFHPGHGMRVRPPPTWDDLPCRARPGVRFAAMATIRVVLAEDNTLLREGVARLIGQHEGLELVGTATDLPTLLQVVDETAPDVVVTDIRMPPTTTDEGIQAARQLRQQHPGIGVVVLSQYSNAEYAISLLSEGSSGRAYLLKDRIADVDELRHAIVEVSEGRSVIDPGVVDGLVGARSHSDRGELNRLTPRESELLGEMAQGKNNAAIAASLYLSERAVEKHTNSIFSKLGLTEEKDVNRRVKAVLLYLAEQADKTK